MFRKNVLLMDNRSTCYVIPFLWIRSCSGLEGPESHEVSTKIRKWDSVLVRYWYSVISSLLLGNVLEVRWISWKLRKEVGLSSVLWLVGFYFPEPFEDSFFVSWWSQAPKIPFPFFMEFRYTYRNRCWVEGNCFLFIYSKCSNSSFSRTADVGVLKNFLTFSE